MPGPYEESIVSSKTRPPEHGGPPAPEMDRNGPGSPALRLLLGVEAVAGLWLLVSTAVLGPSLSLAATGPAWNELGCGVAVAITAWIRWSAPRGAPWAALVTIAVGAWLVTASLVIGRPAADQPVFAGLNELITGIVITVLAVVTATLARRRRA